jgi:hypothetical protein
VTRPPYRPHRMSGVCGAAWDAQDTPTPGAWHPGCSGGVCGCPCHHVTPPTGFRALVDAARPQTPAVGSDREADPAAGTTAPPEKADA